MGELVSTSSSPKPTIKSSQPDSWLVEAVYLWSLMIVLVALFAPMVNQMIVQRTDYGEHLYDVIYWLQHGETFRPRPHFLYQALVLITHTLLSGTTVYMAGWVLGTVLYGLTGLSLHYWIGDSLRGHVRSPSLIAALLVLIVLLVTPITIMGWAEQSIYLGYIVPNTYHNPTAVLLKLTALLLFFQSFRVFKREQENHLLSGVVTFVLTILCLLSKPNYVLCLLPALGLIALYRLARRQYVDWVRLIFALGLPAALILGYQFVAYTSSELSGFYFAPLEIMSDYSPVDTLLPKFLLSVTFPLLVYVLYPRTSVKDYTLNLSWLVFAIGAAMMYLFAERGKYAYHGNFVWGAQIGLFVLFLTSVIFFAKRAIALLRAGIPRDPRFYLCITALLLHGVSGVLWYYVNVSGQFSLDTLFETGGWW